MTSWPCLWQRVFTEIEGAEFAQRIVVEAELGEGLSKKVFPTNEVESYTLVWSVQIK